jgi:DMSO/TMAO reductase YedYZ molybdopterin-dependent catalytic subunit
VRSHLSVPSLDPAAHTIEVAGEVAHPQRVTLRDLAAFPQAERVVTIECAGNGRARFDLPNTSGVQWEHGAVGTARWAGVPLARLLERAQVRATAQHVWFECADGAPMPAVPAFTRSIPLAKAMDDVLVAVRMNGEPLPARHGGPARIVVPGWFGMASAKWVTRIRLEPGPSDNHFMAKGYRYQYPGEKDAPPVESLRVKSVITRPLEGQRVTLAGTNGARTLRVEGFAWAGSSAVARVEVSADAGATWRDAAWRSEAIAGAWRRFAADVPVARPGTLTLLARATDGAGEVQPAAARANAAGYGNNSIHRVRGAGARGVGGRPRRRTARGGPRGARAAARVPGRLRIRAGRRDRARRVRAVPRRAAGRAAAQGLDRMGEDRGHHGRVGRAARARPARAADPLPARALRPAALTAASTARERTR